ncbi:MAG TPA: LLM class flavin-dependent oxidoreductase [Acidimicrobiales bacterium]|nr:LLM class flavin-dependent oxidoreductase [Acidimicrobiales bacterium]
MEVGVALPQLDGVGAGAGARLEWSAVVAAAQEAERLGFASVWLGDPAAGAGFGFDPLVALGALARRTRRVGLGTAPLRAGRRPPQLLLRQVRTLHELAGGRLVVAVGGEGAEGALDVLAGGPAGLWAHGDDAVDLAARHPGCQGWSTGWRCTPSRYEEAVAALDRACRHHGRDPATVVRALALTTLVGEDEADLDRRWRRLGLPTTLEEWRAGRLVGTVDQVCERLAHWRTLGVSQFIAGLGAIPFSAGDPGDLQLLASAIL